MPFVEGRGALFREEKQKENDRDYAGTVNIAGTEFWLSGYVKISKAGKKYLSLWAKPKTDDAKSPETSDAEPF